MDSNETNSSRNDTYRNKVRKGLYFIFGTVFLVFGGVGIFLPILPTTPFLLLTAACYLKSSKRMNNWLLNHKLFGQYIKNYLEGKGISLRAKVISLAFLWTAICF